LCPIGPRYTREILDGNRQVKMELLLILVQFIPSPFLFAYIIVSQ
jgi:hypothetical protein